MKEAARRGAEETEATVPEAARRSRTPSTIPCLLSGDIPEMKGFLCRRGQGSPTIHSPFPFTE